jgi:hypothetical protein
MLGGGENREEAYITPEGQSFSCCIKIRSIVKQSIVRSYSASIPVFCTVPDAKTNSEHACHL